jgi:hypothetical protein
VVNRSDLEHYIRQDKKFVNLYKRRSDNMFYRQQDDCLSLNLYIPTTGKPAIIQLNSTKTRFACIAYTLLAGF